ncbi:MAG: hypothetical protein QOJ82_1202 [Solirubrobacteraceae bacterium]|jgi:hypothetical protein|nr:hypothetical protein [Solirubrobacteraceae bacterium]
MGILMAACGITGDSEHQTAAHSVLARELAYGRELIVITREELEALYDTNDWSSCSSVSAHSSPCRERSTACAERPPTPLPAPQRGRGAQTSFERVVHRGRAEHAVDRLVADWAAPTSRLA